MSTIKGKFLGLGEKKVISDKLTVQSLYLDITEKPEYPNTPEFQIKKDDVMSAVANIARGSEIEVHYNISGRKYVDKSGASRVATNLDAWKIVASTANAISSPTKSTENDLPF